MRIKGFKFVVMLYQVPPAGFGHVQTSGSWALWRPQVIQILQEFAAGRNVKAFLQSNQQLWRIPQWYKHSFEKLFKKRTYITAYSVIVLIRNPPNHWGLTLNRSVLKVNNHKDNSERGTVSEVEECENYWNKICMLCTNDYMITYASVK